MLRCVLKHWKQLRGFSFQLSASIQISQQQDISLLCVSAPPKFVMVYSTCYTSWNVRTVIVTVELSIFIFTANEHLYHPLLENVDYMVCRSICNIHNLRVSSPRNYQLLKPPLPFISCFSTEKVFSNVFNPNCTCLSIDPATSYPVLLGGNITLFYRTNYRSCKAHVCKAPFLEDPSVITHSWQTQTSDSILWRDDGKASFQRLTVITPGVSELQ